VRLHDKAWAHEPLHRLFACRPSRSHRDISSQQRDARSLDPVRAYLLSRLAQGALVGFLSLFALLAMVRLGGDPVLLFMPMDIQAKDVNEFRQRLGFNDPLPLQYARFVGGALRGDFGESLRYRRDALGLVLERLPATLLLAASAVLLTLVVA